MISKRLSNAREKVLDFCNDYGELMSETKRVYFKPEKFLSILMISKRLSNARERVLELYNDYDKLKSETKRVHFKEYKSKY